VKSTTMQRVPTWALVIAREVLRFAIMLGGLYRRVVPLREPTASEWIARIPQLKKRLRRQPSDFGTWFDLGLAYKYERNWPACLNANAHAVAISGERGEPAWWNLGIAATALHNWPEARRAWRGYGINIPDGDGPIDHNSGLTPLRLNDSEVVWGDRLDPARIKIQNIPFADSGYRRGDIVLHDGVPNGERTIEGKTHKVFDAIECWAPSEIPTLAVEITCPDDADSQALVELFAANNFAAEDWTQNVRSVCATCSAGNIDSTEQLVAHAMHRSFGFASPPGLAATLLETWASSEPDRRAFGEIVVVSRS
jgi:hypothetical protein